MEAFSILLIIVIVVIIIVFALRNAKPEVKPTKPVSNYYQNTTTSYSDNKIQNTSISEDIKSRTTTMVKGEFVAMDFETANYSRTSACSIGLAFVKDGVITSKEHYYIKPHPNYYIGGFIEIHGITSEKTDAAPDFGELWNSTLKEKLENRTIVCHNANFDIAVLSAMLSHYGYENHDISFTCTLELSRSTFYLPNYKLPTVCEHIGHNLGHHHDPVDDAVAAAMIYLALCQELGYENCGKRHKLMQIRKPFIDHEFIARLEKRRQEEKERKAAAAVAAKIAQYPGIDVSNQFFMKKVTITGSLTFMKKSQLTNKLRELGANISSVVNDRTDILINGDNADADFLLKAEELKITSFTETDLIKNYSEYFDDCIKK